uniref:RNA-directed DNA polymerase, eukaryota, reverse transcriptase zinc-binding domain protein n=1 Tax=Tanacetum cinerariifolium TaxID=118510 RepID=A0A699HYY3_TANCI|nr:RNA-directed DNA polymerase, eukaryota, reverse transcriptase zinc-binding domain protein [Tanacetum cinerariifolium]
MVRSGSQRSKEDDVQNISTYVFVTNFPDGYGARIYGTHVKFMGMSWMFLFLIEEQKQGANNVNHGAKGMTNSYAYVVKGNQVQNMGMVKEFASLTNLKVVLGKERYANIELKYMGEVPGWVPEFEEDGEEGYDVNGGLHEDDMYGGVLENLKDVKGKSDREEVPETNFEEVPDKSIFEGNSVRQNDVHSKDPFGIYESDENRVNDGHEDGVCVGQHVHERVEVSNDTHESTCSGHFKKSKVPRKGGSILKLIDDLVNMGQTMGYDMTRCIKNMEEIIESQGVDEIHR